MTCQWDKCERCGTLTEIRGWTDASRFCRLCGLLLPMFRTQEAAREEGADTDCVCGETSTRNCPVHGNSEEGADTR